MSKVYFTFTVCDLLFGVAVEQVQEVLHNPEVRPVPLAQDSVLGLLNLRGQIVTVVDARSRLGLAERNSKDALSHVIVRCEEEVVSLVVDSEGDVIEIDSDADDVPDTISSAIRDFLTGIHQLDDDLVLMLDTDRALLV